MRDIALARLTGLARGPLPAPVDRRLGGPGAGGQGRRAARSPPRPRPTTSPSPTPRSPTTTRVFKVNPPLRPAGRRRRGARRAWPTAPSTPSPPTTPPTPRRTRSSRSTRRRRGCSAWRRPWPWPSRELDLPIEQVLALLSWQPARIAGLDGAHGGPVAEGRPANLCVIDPAATWVVEPAALASRSRNTPYAGRKLTGRVRHTVLRGEPVVVDGEAAAMTRRDRRRARCWCWPTAPCSRARPSAPSRPAAWPPARSCSTPC